MEEKCYLAIDIGASSGRHIIGYEKDGYLITDEVYRFSNGVKKKGNHLVWDIESLYSQVLIGIKKAFEKYKSIESLAIDTWGVDYVILTDNGYLKPCLSYRDARTSEAINQVHSIISFDSLYKKTGIQYQPFNTIYQLYDDLMRNRLSVATDFLMIPEFLNYLLTGVKAKEYTNATTTGLVNVNTKSFDKEIIEKLKLPKQLFKKLVQPSTYVGKLTKDISKQVGGQTKVVVCASHDTASAVEAIPIELDQPYISSGTWSLLGIKTNTAKIDDVSKNENWSNEGGVDYVRYQKNVMGLWLVQCLQKELCKDKSFSTIAQAAAVSTFEGSVDVTDEKFLAPESMKEAFDSCFDKNSRPKMESDYFRCAYKSLALGYKKALEELEQNTGKKFEKLYIVGGGAKNILLNDLTQKYCNIKVVALPIEATAIGNLKIQMKKRES